MSIKDSLYQFIGHSSLNYLVQQMYIVYSSTQVLLDFFSEVLQGHWENAREQRTLIIELTQQARSMQKVAHMQLPEDWFAPVSRADIMNLLQLQTRIANKAQAISGVVIGRELALPPALGIEYFPLLSKCIESIFQSYNLVKHLEDIALSRHKAKIVAQLQHMIVELDKLENETDRLQIHARNVLLGLESELYAVDVIALYKVLEWTGELADRAHELGGKLVSILAA